MIWPAQRITEQADKGYGIYDLAKKMEKRGIEVIHLEFGRPSSDTPQHIKDACKQALDRGLVHYSDLQGLPELRQALACRYQDFNGMAIDADQVLITNGVTHAAFAAIMAGVNPGDEVIVLDPFYPQHNSKIRLAGGTVVTARRDRDRGFGINMAALRSALSPSTRMLLLVNPCNPTGVMYRYEELAELALFCREHDLLVLSDEVYEFNTYDGRRHISIASLPGMAERTITVSAFTKAYAMDGWRMGFAVAPHNMIRDMQKITLNDTTHPCTFAQAGAAAAVTGPQDCLAKMVAEDEKRRNLTVQRLNSISGVKCHRPAAAIYAFPDISGLNIAPNKFAVRLLEETHVAVESGTFYGTLGASHLRICFGAQPYHKLDEALDRIETFVKSGRYK